MLGWFHARVAGVSGGDAADVVPRTVAVGGLAIVVAAFLPLHPEGFSFIDLVAIELSRGVVEAVLMVAGFGSPFLYGLACIAVALVVPMPLARRLVRIPIALMHSQLLLVAIVLWRGGHGIAPVPLLGFAVVSGGYMAIHSARTHAEGGGPRLGWYVRWGAVVITAIAAWSELQRFADVHLGLALHVVLGGALLIVAAMGTRPLHTAAPIERPC
jgi:hypothetical protein